MCAGMYVCMYDVEIPVEKIVVKVRGIHMRSICVCMYVCMYVCGYVCMYV